MNAVRGEVLGVRQWEIETPHPAVPLTLHGSQ
jgi:hypothetical protein